ncbi:MAG: hypothetical protein ACOH10_10530 [Rhodoglobus sp.]
MSSRSAEVPRRLMRAVASGDVAAFSRLYDLLCVATYSIFRQHFPVQEHADLAMNDMWISVWRNARALHSQPGTTSDKIIAAAEAQARVSVAPAA